VKILKKQQGGRCCLRFFIGKGITEGIKENDRDEKKKVNKGARMLNNVQQEKL